jgi:hypothetical protein
MSMSVPVIDRVKARAQVVLLKRPVKMRSA